MAGNQRIETLEKAVTALVRGSMATHEAMDAKLDKILEAQAADIKTDREVIERLSKLCECMEQLCAVLGAPVHRESVINLPSGPVSMTVREVR